MTILERTMKAQHLKKKMILFPCLFVLLSSGTEECLAANINGTNYYCEWDYNGLGLEYQLLAGT